MRRSPFLITFFNTLFLIFNVLPISARTILRYKQSAVYDSSQDRIVFVGGSTAASNNTADVFSLDLSSSFNRTATNFTTLPSLASAVSDAAAVIDDDGMLHVLGGQQDACTSNISYQVLNNTSSAWSTPTLSGTVPGPRSGARATILAGEILFFGGESLTNCSADQYYYNTLYDIDPNSANCTLFAGTNPPVAEAGMTMTAMDDTTFMLIGGEAVSSSSTATWVGMSQYAVYDSNATSWSYLSIAGGSTVPTARSGHTAVFNGSHTFVYGGAIGNVSSTPTFLSIDSEGSSVDIATLSTTNDTAAPPASLFGHSAIITKNSIMIIAFGLVGSAASSTFNDAVYLYDTIGGTWLDRYDPTLNQKIDKTAGLSKAVIAVIVVVSVLLIGTVACLVLLFFRRRKAHNKNRTTYPINRLGIFTPDNDSGNFEKNVSTETGMREVHLPPWAAMHACHARSKSPPPKTVQTQNPSILGICATDDQRAEYDVQDVQFACPPSPRVLTFTAPKLQLRVVNPETAIGNALTDDSRGYPELFETTSSGITTSVPISITNEDDLELLRSKLSEEPMIGDINDHLAGLGLVLRDELFRVPETGTLRRIRTISKPLSGMEDVIIPRLSFDRISTTSLLDSVLPMSKDSSRYRPEDSSPIEPLSYSPYFDSPRSEISSQGCCPSPHKLSEGSNSIVRRPKSVCRRSSWSSNSSKTSLIPWTKQKASQSP